jgi:uncharacterized FlgJ-related protein
MSQSFFKENNVTQIIKITLISSTTNNMFRKSILLILILTTFSSLGDANPLMSRTEYYNKYQNLAVEQMQTYGIPASITLAQGILESNSGSSILATKAHNHFGIKCHSNWTGEKIYLDDDAANECFRSYDKAEESYIDHSEFLKKGKRYQFLFSYNQTDYVNWARGLKQAGYATNPKYADLLIQIIEELKLNKLDEGITPLVSSFKNEAIQNNSRTTHINQVDFVIAKPGDTYYQIARRNGITLRQIHKYNDIDSKKDVLLPGEMVYLEPKRHHSRKKDFIVLEKTMTLREVSQQEAIRLKSLMRKNQSSSPDEQLPKGDQVFLR